MHTRECVNRGQTTFPTVDAASNVLQRGDINAAVGILRADLGGDKGAFRDAILTLLYHPSFPGELRQGLIEQALDLAPDAAVRDDDQDFARYLLDKGANPDIPKKPD